MEFESVADELYALDREEFIKVRDQRAAEARKAGEKELATRLRKLRKPTSAAWLVNRLVREWPKQVTRLAELGEALRAAHQELAGDRLRTLSRQRHELVQQLTDKAVSLAGGPVGDAVAREVYDTLDAALTDPDSGRAVAEGRLTTALRPGDPFSGDWLAVGPAPAKAAPENAGTETTPPKTQQAPTKKQAPKTQKTRETPRAPNTRTKQKAPEPQVPEAGEAADGRAADAATERQAREDSARRRRDERKRLRAVLAEARTERNEAVRELRTAEREEAEARRRTASARKTFEAADRRVAEAEAELDQLDGSH